MDRGARRAFVWTNRVANPLLARVLRTRAGRGLGRRLAVVEYTGRRTGAGHRLVAQYRRDRSAVVIQVGAPDRKTWWRNFSTPAPVHLRLAGVEHDGRGRVVRDGSVRVLVDLTDVAVDDAA